MLPQYYTVKQSGAHEIVIQKSRFICHAKRVTTEKEAQDFIQGIKKEHWSANHNCSAYLIGERDQFQKANDDGEPSGTAGVPMLEVLKRKELKDTVVVVTRYFGGIKLGAGGLVRAYSNSVSEGLTNIGIVKCTLMQIMHTKVDYTWLGKLENELRNSPYALKEIHYADNVIVDTFVEESQKDAFTAWMTELTNGQADISAGEVTYLEEEI